MTDYLTRAEAAALLSVSVSTIDRHARGTSPTLTKYRLDGGRAIRFRRADVVALLTEKKSS